MYTRELNKQINTRKSFSNILLFILILIFSGCAKKGSSENHFYSLEYDSLSSSKQIAVIFPGMGQKVSKAEYLTVGEFYKLKGITPVYVNIDWRKTGINKLSMAAEQIGAELSESFSKSHIYLFGFSFGAVIAYKVSEVVKPEQILLCSMSPLFKEDRKYQIFPFRQIGNMFINASSDNLSYIKNKGQCYVFLYGDHDSFLINKAIIEHRKTDINCNETRIVKNAKHDISKPEYLDAIKNSIAGFH